VLTQPSIWQSLTESFREAWPTDAAAHVGIIVGCSGGADSVALVRLIADCFCANADEGSVRQSPLVVAHFNHELRGDQSDADEQFVRALAASLDFPVEVGRPTHDSSPDDEARLRTDRREFFLRIAAKWGCRYIAVAHTADDQAETVLHHLFRGTGSSGLCGMQLASPLGSDFIMLRPLLQSRRACIRTALQQIGQSWSEDASNQSTRYTRNWIRHQVLPTVRERFPQADDALVRAAENQNQLGQMLNRLAQQWVDAFVCPVAVDDEQPIGFTDARPLEFRRPSFTVMQRHASSDGAWPHGHDLANEHAVIIAACQLAFDARRWPRRHMNQQHWTRLAHAIATTGNADLPSRATSLGHWPGHLEGIQTADAVVLSSQLRV
jgi:tRNA(Ile)-lysidine synthase